MLMVNSSAGLKVCKGLWTYYDTWKDYQEDVAVICDSLTGIENTLTLLQNSMTARPKPPPNEAHDESCRDAVQRCKATMGKLREKLGEIENSNSSGGLRRQAKFQWKKVKYPFKERKIFKLRGLLVETKSDLQLLLHVLRLNQSDQLSLNMANANEYVTDLQKSKKDKKYKEVLDWVCTVDPSAKHGDTNSKKEPGTCNWLFQRPEFDEWKTQGSVLWIKGELGCGKSVLCSAAIEHMKLYCTTTPGTILLYYYFSFTNQSLQNTTICLSSLLRQLCTESTSIMAMVEQMHEKFHQNHNNPKKLAFDDVQTCLQSAIAELTKDKKDVYVVIDALDELPDDREGLQRAQMLKWIVETSSREIHLHLLFTSRVGFSCIDIEKTMESQSRLYKISIDAVTNHDDIRLYLEGQFQGNKNLKNLGNVARVNIIEKLIGKSGGMFQWVSWQLYELKGLPPIARPKDIEEVINSMPPTLGECYMRILQGVNSRFQPEIAKALQWISLSLRPLDVKEVNEACIIDVTKLPAINGGKFRAEGIATCLSSFVTRRGYKNTELSLCHFSVKEFLSSTIQDSAYSRYGFREGVAHASIAESCIAYIYYYSHCTTKLNTRSDFKYFPLLLYACQHWFHHLKLAAEEEQERLAPLVMGFLTSGGVYSYALTIYNPLYPVGPFPCKIYTLASPFGWAAVLGLEFLVKRLLKESQIEIDAIHDPVPGHEPSAGISTEICSDSNHSPLPILTKFDDPIRGTALMNAVARNHENVVRLLIENGADLHHIEQGYAGDSNSALSIACDNGNAKMVGVLLGYGADPNEICGNWSALASATFRGSLDVCKLLLDRGASINLHMEHDSNGPCDILSIAARNGDVQLVELFLSWGIHIGPQALLWSLWPEEEMYEVDDETDDGTDDGVTYDNQAISKKRVCELLILHGANLNPDPTGLFDTPLAMALRFKWYDIFELMLRKGARVDPSDPSCLTAGNILIAASNSVDMTRHILDMGVDANAPGVFVKPFGEEDLPATGFSNALQAAAFRNNPGVVELLLDRNADLKITGPPYGNALYAVAGRIISDQYVSDSDVSKALKICKMLLAKGAKWSTKHLPEDKELRENCLLGRYMYRALC
ncbi:uncharacterized protein TRUGW13939_05715 [Talaromyces rugulosus]|uniref:Nephrocystin 3-like N-terminal domain-containing protein n=1 Tax=Talaromyces rugulosus TaxID=121627 RepID=A0A7H8QWX8_TALRU|nr:uncharacterized protein TRUGW13939_05715 [Talaromyces rugulosus]QKX58590.1 hypothetical protein TRUGW13939_05715 [Talaromyces rugulosus]